MTCNLTGTTPPQYVTTCGNAINGHGHVKCRILLYPTVSCRILPYPVVSCCIEYLYPNMGKREVQSCWGGSCSGRPGKGNGCPSITLAVTASGAGRGVPSCRHGSGTSSVRTGPERTPPTPGPPGLRSGHRAPPPHSTLLPNTGTKWQCGNHKHLIYTLPIFIGRPPLQ